MQRFVDNSRRTATERSGQRRKPLTTEELENQRRWWIKRVQAQATKESKFVLEKTQFNLVGVDFAGPIRYKVKQKQEKKAYLVLFSCSLTRGVYLELVKGLETAEFLQTLNRFIARKGRPTLIYSDNGQTLKQQLIG